MKSTFRRKIWQLAWPMILSNLSVPLLGAVDTAILGRLQSPVYLGAVAVGASILTLLYWSMGFLRMGTTSLVARAFGREDQSECRLLLLQSGVLALVLSLVLLVLQIVILPLALHLMHPSAAVAELALSYGHIRLWSAPATLLNYVLIGWFIGQQDTRSPLLILVSTNLLNILLDAVFILGMDLHSDGAALASVCAEYLSLGPGIYLLRRKLYLLGGSWHWQALRQLDRYWQLLRVNRHLFVRTLCLLLVFNFFTAQGAHQGDQVLAANAILLQLLMLTAHALDGFAHAAEALTGRAIGAGKLEDFYQACRASTLFALEIAVLLSIIFIAGRDIILPLFTNLDAVLALTRKYYLWICLLPLVSIWAYQCDGIFLGSGQTRAMQYTVIAAALLVFLPLWWFTRSFGNHGLWFAFTLFNLARGVLLGLSFLHRHRTKTWLPS